jgi:hypothetical protein
MMHERSSNELPEFQVSVWEGIAVATGFVLLTAVGLIGLGLKFIGNSVDPAQAEAIAQSLMSYDIPGGETGLFGTNIGAAKIALVGSQTTLSVKTDDAQTPLELPKIELFVARTPVDSSLSSATPAEALESAAGLSFSYQPSSAFEVVTTRTEPRSLCSVPVSVRIETGRLVIGELGGWLPAIRYDTGVVLDEYIHLVTLYVLGENPQSDAEAVFRSLRCR